MPDIVYVDNEPDELVHHASLEQKARISDFKFGDPATLDLAFGEAREASLWLFDFFLVDEQNSPEGVENGLSLFNKWRSGMATGRPVTVLVSNHLEKALGQPPGPLARHHVQAQRLGVEWIGDKSEETLSRIMSLADGSRAISDALGPIEADAAGESVPVDVERICFDVLGVPRNAQWANSAQRQVDRARPPRIEPPLTGFGASRPIIAWLVGHVLPYPSFLLSDAEAAVRLGVSPTSFGNLAAAQTEGELVELRYSGPLAEFHGRRWWRAAVDNFAWKMSQAEQDYREVFQHKAGQVELDWLTQTEPVLVSDANLVETETVADASECVRAADEDFPANVEPAWVRIADVKEDKKLAAKVIFEDRELLEDSE